MVILWQKRRLEWIYWLTLIPCFWHLPILQLRRYMNTLSIPCLRRGTSYDTQLMGIIYQCPYIKIYDCHHYGKKVLPILTWYFFLRCLLILSIEVIWNHKIKRLSVVNICHLWSSTSFYVLFIQHTNICTYIYRIHIHIYVF